MCNIIELMSYFHVLALVVNYFSALRSKINRLTHRNGRNCDNGRDERHGIGNERCTDDCHAQESEQAGLEFMLNQSIIILKIKKFKKVIYAHARSLCILIFLLFIVNKEVFKAL